MGSSHRTGQTWWVGPIAFAGVMITVAGLFNLISGLAAVFADAVFVTAPAGVLVLDVTGWGWVHVATGVGLFVTGLALLTGQVWARVVGVVLVVLNMATQLLLMPAYPFWSLAIIALDTVVIWAIVAHGDEVRAG